MKTVCTYLSAVVLVLASALLASASGCAGSPTQQSTGEMFDDAATTAKVKAALVKDPVVSGLDVGVDTFKGQVQLNGFVDTAEQKARAEQIARTVSGVLGVGNKLTVKTRVSP